MEENQEQHSIAMEVLQYSKEQNKISNNNLMSTNKRLFIALMTVVILWFGTICFGAYYITHYGFEVTDESAETKDGGNACVGNNCYNGDIDYGESKKDD